MNNAIDAYDYQQYSILFVDDEANTRKYFRRLFSEKFRILEAEDGVEALKIFRQHAEEIAIIVTDQRMPNETGVEFLSKIAPDYPDIIKILSTAYSDIDAAIGSVNEGGIFRYMTKPWDIPQLEVTLRRAMEFFMIKRERDALLGAKIQALGNVLMSSRLSAFALVPVCTKLSCERAAQAIASFVQTGVAGQAADADRGSILTSPGWADIHARQVALATLLEDQLPKALAIQGLDARTSALALALTEIAGTEASSNLTENQNTVIKCAKDPMPGLLQILLGADAQPADQAIRILAAYMAIHDAGGIIRRKRGEGLTIQISTAAPKDDKSDPGSEVAQWLFDDDMLISAALGLI